jgi:hypothetical protein
MLLSISPLFSLATPTRPMPTAIASPPSSRSPYRPVMASVVAPENLWLLFVMQRPRVVQRLSLLVSLHCGLPVSKTIELTCGPDVRTNCHVTKITFDKSTPPRATGVEFLDGQYLYKASPKNGGNAGVAGSVAASREVIISGGTYNSPQVRILRI